MKVSININKCMLSYTTLEQSKRLKEFGYPDESEMVYLTNDPPKNRCGDLSWSLEKRIPWTETYDFVEWYASPSVEELIEWIRQNVPIRLYADEKGFVLEILSKDEIEVKHLDPHSFTKLMDILFSCACWVLEQKNQKVIS